jgi:hypothetical protein
MTTQRRPGTDITNDFRRHESLLTCRFSLSLMDSCVLLPTRSDILDPLLAAQSANYHYTQQVLRRASALKKVSVSFPAIH